MFTIQCKQDKPSGNTDDTNVFARLVENSIEVPNIIEPVVFNVVTGNHYVKFNRGYLLFALMFL